MLKHKIDYQLVPLHLHQRNAATHTIQTFQFLCTAHPKYPAKEWDRLNLLRQCRYNPKLSAYAAIFGPFDFNATPLAPFSTKCLIHKKTGNQATWSPRGGGYIHTMVYWTRYASLSMCGMFYSNHTFDQDRKHCGVIPHIGTFPQSTTEDALGQATADILHLLQHPTPSLPFLTYGDSTRSAI